MLVRFIHHIIHRRACTHRSLRSVDALAPMLATPEMWTEFADAYQGRQFPQTDPAAALAAARSKCAGSYSSPAHARISSRSGLGGPASSSLRSTNPPGPPQSSGGHAPLPPVHSGYTLAASAGALA